MRCIKMSAYKIIITRELTLIAAAKTYKVEIDGFYAGDLRNGATLIADTTPGPHVLSLKTPFGKTEREVHFVIPEDSNITNIYGKMDKLHSVLDLSIKNAASVPAAYATPAVYADTQSSTARAVQNDSSPVEFPRDSYSNLNYESPPPQSTPENKSDPEKPRRTVGWLIKSALLWFGAILFIILGITLLPTLAGFLYIMLGMVLLPFAPVWNFFQNIGIRGKVRAGVAIVLLILCGVTYKPSSEGRNEQPEEPPAETASVSEQNDLTSDNPEQNAGEDEQHPAEDTAQQDSEPEPTEDSFINYDFNTDGYDLVSAGLIYEYGQYMVGRNVITVIQSAQDSSYRTLYTKQGKENAIGYSISFDLNDRLPRDAIHEGDYVTIAGTIEKTGGIISSVTLGNCQIVGLGEIGQEINATLDSQRAVCEQYKKAVEDAAAAEIQAARENYITECVSVSYNDVERNPDNYDGVKIKVSGTVRQVIEGWLDSVTLRVTDSDENTWMITYKHKDGESRILEGDTITAYGECTGVTNVTNLLGAQMTVPSMSMQYYS